VKLIILLLCLAGAFNVDLFCFAQFPAVLALCHRSAFLLDFEERAIGVLAGAGAVTFNARFAASRNFQ
jgi:hypothetical protein